MFELYELKYRSKNENAFGDCIHFSQQNKSVVAYDL